jgi:hypothetical protein
MTQTVSIHDDPVMEELWKFREEFCRRFDGDIDAMAEEMNRVAAASGRPSISRRPKPSKGLPPRGSKPVDRGFLPAE